MASELKVTGAKMHNLKNIDVSIPRDKLVVITGVSGSGKSSLAFDTIYAEGQRRYVESLSAYARQFLQLMEKPEVENIEGLSPAISIDQKSTSRNPRSTVGTVTEIYDYLRLLFAKVGRPHCPECGDAVTKQSISQIVDKIADLPEGKRIMLLAPVVRDRKGEHLKVLEKIKKDGFVRMRIDGEIVSIAEEIKLDPKQKHTIEIVVDRLIVKNFKKKITTLSSGQEIEEPNPDRSRLADSVEVTMKYGEGVMTLLDADTQDAEVYSEHFACIKCGISIPEIEPRSFSFNSPHGACPECHGLGSKLVVLPELVVPNEKLTLAEGAILPWATTTSRMNWHMKMLEAVGKKYGFTMNSKWKDLNEEQKEAVLYGTGEEKYDLNMNTEKFSGNFEAKYEGVISNLERRYLETESDFGRKQIEKFMEVQECPSCKGQRLRSEILAVTVAEKNIMDVTGMSIENARQYFLSMLPEEKAMSYQAGATADKKEISQETKRLKSETLSQHSNTKDEVRDVEAATNILTENEYKIGKSILKEIANRLSFLENVGLSYLTLDRSAVTLSGGEAQRIRLATQIGSALQGVLYVLDEPSIGLHQKDNARLIETMTHLRNLENTVLVVEHDEDTMRAADHILEIGPKAGKHGGLVIAEGTPAEIMQNENSVTGKYLSGEIAIPVPKKRRKGTGKFVEIIGATEHNLKNVDAKIPLGCFVGITGVSGSGKSTLINHILSKELARMLNRAQTTGGAHKEIKGVENLDKIIHIDQSPIGRTPRSNPATYTGVFTDIRDLFATTSEAKLRGYKAGRFSFNVKGGRCESCAGDGIVKIEMHFLPDIYVPCEICKGRRYNTEALEVTWRGKNIADVLDMTVSEALEFFTTIPQIKKKLQTLEDVGLGYIHLGQSATTLSGGEAQRVKLATELSKRATGKTLYVLDEPTTGLHFDDVKKLLAVLQALVDKGNTVLAIEHNLDVIKSVDYILDLGPDGGDQGGLLVAEGLPEEVAQVKESYTGQYLAKILK